MLHVKEQIIIVVDIVDFTLKSSLLSYKELDHILRITEKIVSMVTNFGGSIVKGTGDGYIIFFPYVEAAINYVDYILGEFNKYNSNQLDFINKIYLHISITYGELLKKKLYYE